MLETPIGPMKLGRRLTIPQRRNPDCHAPLHRSETPRPFPSAVPLGEAPLPPEVPEKGQTEGRAESEADRQLRRAVRRG
jgi:hypothetical protein